MDVRRGEREDSRKASSSAPQRGKREGKGGEHPEAEVRRKKEAQGTAACGCQESGELVRLEVLHADQGFPSAEERTWAHPRPPPKVALK